MALPTRTETFNNLYTTTFNNRKSGIIDQIFDIKPGLNFFKRKGKISFDGTGGRYLEVPLMYGKNATVVSIGRGDTIALNETAFLTAAQYEWKFMAGTIINYFVDSAQNKSKQAAEKLVNAKIDNLKMSLEDKMEEMIFSDGTGNSSKDFEGLGNLVDDSPTSSLTVGNIAQSTTSWWRNKQKTATGAASVYLRKDMSNLYNTCSLGDGAGFIDGIITDQTSYELYEDEVLEQRRLYAGDSPDTSFKSGLLFKGAEMIWSPDCTSGYMYFLNTRYLGFVMDPEIYFMMTEFKPIPNSLDTVAQVVVKGNLVTTRRSAQGVLTGIAA